MKEIRSVSTISPFSRDFPRSRRAPDYAVIAYMESFDAAWMSAGRVYDPVVGEYVDIQLDAFTDGEWGWDSSDIYLYREYSLKLPDEFVSKAAAIGQSR